MKLMILPILLLCCILLASCNNDAAIGIIGGADGPTAILVSDGKDNNADADGDIQHIPITLEEIDREMAKAYDAHSYIHSDTEYTQYLLIKPTGILTDVKLCIMELADELRPGKTIYSLDELNDEKPLMLGVVFWGDFTTYGLSFNDANGEPNLYIIYTSGKDGSAVLQKTE